MAKSGLVTGLLLGAALLAGACSQSADKAVPTANASADPSEPAVTGAPEETLIRGCGGTKIAVLVNKQPITTNQIRRRAAFVRLRRMKGNSTTVARNELIDEALKLQEAARLNVVPSDTQVNQAYSRFARGNKMSVSQLNSMLSQTGVTQRGFKDYVRASLAWQSLVATRIRRQSGASGASAQSWLSASSNGEQKATEYTITQIVFIVPASQRSRLLARRRVEAKRYRAQLNGCTNARELAKGLKDVTVLDGGRLLESELPPRWAKQIKATPAGKVTRVQDDPKGVEMIAVCRTREVIGGGTGIDNNLLSGGGSSASKIEKEYLAELKKRAVIQRR